jgi:hypothetical protein
LIVRSDLSHRVVVDPAKPEPVVGANVADHEMIVLDVRYVELLVSYGAVLSVNEAAAVPLQVPLL